MAIARCIHALARNGQGGRVWRCPAAHRRHLCHVAWLGKRVVIDWAIDDRGASDDTRAGFGGASTAHSAGWWRAQ